MAATDWVTEYDPRTGVPGSGIETQDEVAAIVALEALLGRLQLVPGPLRDLGGRIVFESRDDFEIRWLGGRQFVSVKDRQVNRSDLLEAIQNLIRSGYDLTSRDVETSRIEAASLSTNARTLYEDIERLRALKENAVPTHATDYERASAHFERTHGIDPALAERLVVSDRRMGRSPTDTVATFARSVRTIVPAHRFGPWQIDELFGKIVGGVFRDRRRVRGSVDLADLEHFLAEPAASASVFADMADYDRTPFGYVPNQERTEWSAREQALVRSASEGLMREWRRKTRLFRLRNRLTRKYWACVACRDPLNGNSAGRDGLVCPTCGYQPFLTLFYACGCGAPVLMARQPEVSDPGFVRDAIESLHRNDVRCDECGKHSRDEAYVDRVFTLPVPYPIRGYPQNELHTLRANKESVEVPPAPHVPAPEVQPDPSL